MATATTYPHIVCDDTDGTLRVWVDGVEKKFKSIREVFEVYPLPKISRKKKMSKRENRGRSPYRVGGARVTITRE